MPLCPPTTERSLKMRRMSPPVATVLATAALLSVLAVGSASAQTVTVSPTGGTTASRIAPQEAGSTPSATTSPRIVATARTSWFALPKWSELARVKSALVRPDWGTIRSRLAGR
jgi:L-asparaginase/Glu-tRNA(Gln) amidotransferase subunit D